MAVLLVWEEVPDNTKLFLLNGELADAAVKAHGCFVNMVDGDPHGAANKLSEMLDGIEPLDIGDGPIATDGIQSIAIAGFLL